MRLLAILFLAFLVSCNTSPTSDDLTGEWLALRGCEASGSVFQFSGDHKLFVHSVGSDSTTEMQYDYDKSTRDLTFIYRGETVGGGKVTDLNSDYLTIETTDADWLGFVKVKNVTLNIGRTKFLERLQNTSWILRHEFDTMRMDFLSIPPREDKRLPFDAMNHWITPPNKDHALWNAGSYDGKLFLYFTRSGEEITQQVLEATPDRIVLSMPVVESAAKVQEMERTRKQSQDLIDRLTSTRLASVRTDTTWSGEEGVSNYDDNDSRDLQSMLKRIELTFTSNTTYSFTADGQPWRSGHWKMSDDNAYIILDNEYDRFNWMEVRQEEGHFVLTKLQKIKTGYREFKIYLLVINMK